MLVSASLEIDLLNLALVSGHSSLLFPLYVNKPKNLSSAIPGIQINPSTVKMMTMA